MSATDGYQEIEHTADWALAVWAKDLPSLLEQAARGMYALSGARLLSEPRQQRVFELAAGDPEKLLVSFLAELLYYGEQEKLGFDCFQLSISADRLHARVEGAPLAAVDKEIKAVTYHNLRIIPTKRGLEAQSVFDV
jgi:SHS2 domain-containing protein